MNWENVSKGLCPKCSEILRLSTVDQWIECENTDCDFRARQSKLAEIVKGKQSKAYQKKVAIYKGYKLRRKKIKKHGEMIKKVLDSERASNLRRMLAQGLITQQEYDTKTKT